MEEFRKKIKVNRILFMVFILFAVAFSIYNVFFISSTNGGSFDDGTVAGFQLGLILGLGFISALQFVRLSKALKDEKKLKILYNELHDERMILIRSKAGMPMLIITSIIMIVAAVIAGYFNITVFRTLVAAAAVQLVIGAAVKIYCLKTM